MAPPLARGANKSIAIATEASFAVQAPGPGQLLRRTEAVFALTSQQATGSEWRPSHQIAASYEGVRSTEGTISGMLTNVTYRALFEGLLQGTWAQGGVVYGLLDSTLTIDGTTGIITMNGPADQFMHAVGLKVGDVFEWVGLTGGPAANNGINMRLSGVTDTALTIMPMPGTVGFTSGQTESIAVVGKKLVIPQSGQVQRSFSVEEWHADTGESRLWLGNRITQMTLSIPASGYVSMQAHFLGSSLVRSSSPVYASPGAVTQTGPLSSVQAKISYNGVDLGVVTSMAITVAADAVVAHGVDSQYPHDVYTDTVRITGNFSALTASDALTADFLAANEVQIAILLSSGQSVASDFISIVLPRVKLTSMTNTDGDLHITRQFNFVALEQTAGGPGTPYEATSIVFQDSLIDSA